MVRWLLVGLVALTAAVACEGKPDAPVVKPGVAAGEVLEVQGTVSATRGPDTRTLAAGSEISGDDVIETGSDGRVVIALAHNNARWELGANKQEQVARSLAWSLARQDQPAKLVEEATSAAGRHAEKAAANTAAEVPAATTGVSSSAPEAEVDAEPELDAAARRDEKAAPVDRDPSANRQRKAIGSSPGARPSSPAATPPAPAPTDPQDSSVGRGGGSTIAADPKAVEPSRKLEKASGGPTFGDPMPESGERTDRGARDEGEVVGAELEAMLVREKAAIGACLEAKTSKLALAITVVNGKATFAVTDPAISAKTRACLASIAKRLSFPVIGTTVKRTLTYVK